MKAVGCPLGWLLHPSQVSLTSGKRGSLTRKQTLFFAFVFPYLLFLLLLFGFFLSAEKSTYKRLSLGSVHDLSRSVSLFFCLFVFSAASEHANGPHPTQKKENPFLTFFLDFWTIGFANQKQKLLGFHFTLEAIQIE